MLIKNGTVLSRDQLEANTDVRVSDGRITALSSGLQPKPGEQVIDADGQLALPGFVDLHTHGIRDVLVQENGLVKYSRYQLEQGVTACTPTLLGSVTSNIAAMRAGLQETDSFRRTPNILGFRLELPYLFKPGAAQPSALAAIESSATQALYEAGEGHIKIWDVSPELEAVVPFIEWATAQGIVTSLAHTSATIEQTRRAVDAGMSLVTHLFDTFDLPIELDPGVYPAGLVDYVLIEDRLTAEIIPDGVHVHPYLVEETLRCKGTERTAFITDSVRGAGNPPGRYAGLYAGTEIEVTADRGVRRTLDDGLSGSALTQLVSFQNSVLKFGRSIPAASCLCSRTPARVLGARKKGLLALGMDADIVILDCHLRLIATIIGGELAYQSLSLPAID